MAAACWEIPLKRPNTSPALWRISAAGEECKRATVRNSFNEAEIIVACRNAEGQWRLAPRVWGQGMRPAVVTASQTEGAKE